MRDLRPRLHAMPPRNWMNDPNGLVWHDGWYHLFYQHNPYQPTWGSIHWGHLRSRDLLCWEELPFALIPDTAAGEEHCFSGNIVMVAGKPALFYTSIGPDHDAHAHAEQWLAHGSPDLVDWQRDPRNPILSVADNGDLAVLEWRDPFVWQEDGRFCMVLGGTLDNQGCVLIYTSDDLIHWSSPQILYRTSRFRGCECPNYFALSQTANEPAVANADTQLLPDGDIRLLLYSPYDNVHAVLGRQTGDNRFDVMREFNLDEGGAGAFYAANTLLSPDGRRLMFGWISDAARGQLTDDASRGLDWNGLQSFPREIKWLDGRLLIRPVGELAGLRQMLVEPQQMQSMSSGQPPLPERMAAGQPDRFAGDQWFWRAGPAWEFLLTDPGAAPSFELILTNDASENATLNYDAATGRIDLDRSGSSTAVEVDKTARSLQLDQPLQSLQIFYDNSVLEIFVNDQVCLTARVYPLAAAYDRILWIPQMVGRASGHASGCACVQNNGSGSRADISETSVWNLDLPAGGELDVQAD